MHRGVIAVMAMGVAALLGSHANAADTVRGKQVFNRCKACHTFDRNGKSHTGPNLYGVVGRKAASVPDFDYSRAMKKAAADGLVWTPDKLNAWLSDPRAMIPGTPMNFRGLKKGQDRADVIAYLETSSKPTSGR